MSQPKSEPIKRLSPLGRVGSSKLKTTVPPVPKSSKNDLQQLDPEKGQIEITPTKPKPKTKRTSATTEVKKSNQLIQFFEKAKNNKKEHQDIDHNELESNKKEENKKKQKLDVSVCVAKTKNKKQNKNNKSNELSKQERKTEETSLNQCGKRSTREVSNEFSLEKQQTTKSPKKLREIPKVKLTYQDIHTKPIQVLTSFILSHCGDIPLEISVQELLESEISTVQQIARSFLQEIVNEKFCTSDIVWNSTQEELLEFMALNDCNHKDLQDITEIREKAAKLMFSIHGISNATVGTTTQQEEDHNMNMDVESEEEEPTYLLTPACTIDDLREWPIRALASCCDKWDTINMIEGNSWKHEAYCDLFDYACSVLDEMQQNPHEIDSLVPIRKWFDGTTENWEIENMAVHQLISIVKQECERNNINTNGIQMMKFKILMLENEVKEIRDSIRDSTKYQGKLILHFWERVCTIQESLPVKYDTQNKEIENMDEEMLQNYYNVITDSKDATVPREKQINVIKQFRDTLISIAFGNDKMQNTPCFDSESFTIYTNIPTPNSGMSLKQKHYTLHPDTALQEIKKWPIEALFQVIQNWMRLQQKNNKHMELDKNNKSELEKEVKMIRMQLKNRKAQKQGLRRSSRLNSNKFSILQEEECTDPDDQDRQIANNILTIDMNTPTWNIENLNEKEALTILENLVGDTILQGNLPHMSHEERIQKIIEHRDSLIHINSLDGTAGGNNINVMDVGQQQQPNTEKGSLLPETKLETVGSDEQEEYSQMDYEFATQPTNDESMHDALQEQEGKEDSNSNDDVMSIQTSAQTNFEKPLEKDCDEKSPSSTVSPDQAQSKTSPKIDLTTTKEVVNPKAQQSTEQTISPTLSNNNSHDYSQTLQGLKLNDINIKNNITSTHVPPAKDTNPHVPFLKNTSIMRAKISVKSPSTHAPTLIKRVLKTVRMMDTTITILPFQQNENSNLIITNEQDIPNNQKEISTWVTGIRISKQKKLEFSVRISHTQSIKEVKSAIHEWCLQNKCWLSFDQIHTESIFMAGWIKGIHPHLYDREKVKQYILAQKPELKDIIHVYYRAIWQYNNETSKKTITEAIIIDGDLFQRKLIMQALYSLQWRQPYHYAQFIPFKLSPSFRAEHQQRAMQLHNTYMGNIKSKFIKVSSTSKTCQIPQVSESQTIADWISTAKHLERQIFFHTETINETSIKVIYFKIYEGAVNEFIVHMFKNFSNIVGQEIAASILGSENSHAEQLRNYNLETAFEVACAESLGNIPIQNSVHRNTTNQTLSYGEVIKRNIQKKSIQSQLKQSPTNVITQEDTHLQQPENNSRTEENINIKELKNQILIEIKTEVDSKINNQSKNLYASLESVKQQFQEKLKSTEQNIQNLIDEKESLINNQVKSLIQLIETSNQQNEIKEKIRNDIAMKNHEQMMDAISLLTIKAPSAVELSRRGVKP